MPRSLVAGPFPLLRHPAGRAGSNLGLDREVTARHKSDGELPVIGEALHLRLSNYGAAALLVILQAIYQGFK